MHAIYFQHFEFRKMPKYMHRKIQLLRPPSVLPKSGHISGVVLILGGAAHIVFGVNPVGVSVGVSLSCLHNIL